MSFNVFALGAALGPMEAEWLLLPAVLVLLALGFLITAYCLQTKNSRKWIKVCYFLLLILPQSVLASYGGYVAAMILAKPYFTSLVTTPIQLRLDLDGWNRPVFFFSEYQIKDGLDHDPYSKYLLEYPKAVFELSENGQNVNATIVIEYSYGEADRFWLTHIELFPVTTNRIHGGFIPPHLSTIEGVD